VHMAELKGTIRGDSMLFVVRKGLVRGVWTG
jgi:hypothetical protein